MLSESVKSSDIKHKICDMTMMETLLLTFRVSFSQLLIFILKTDTLNNIKLHLINNLVLHFVLTYVCNNLNVFVQS